MFFGSGNNCCWIIIILLVLCFCCGGNDGFLGGATGGCGCNNGCNPCGC